MAPELVAEFTLALNEELNRARAEAEIERHASSWRLVDVEKQLEGLITATSEGLRAPGLQQRLDTLEAEKARLQQLLLDRRQHRFAFIPISQRSTAEKSKSCTRP